MGILFKPNFLRSFTALAALFLLNVQAFAAGQAVNQTNAQAVAEELNRKGSDQSMQSSTTSAMKALMHFADGEMPSAISNGMTAYGKYRNSENLDKLGDQNILNEIKMSSAGSGVTAPKKTSTSFRRLDPSFMKTGEAASIAAEFEKRSGMKRETFLKELSDVSEKKISRNDPQLMDKVMSRLESFASRIPNKDFRGKIEAGIQRVPATVRNGLVAKAISKFAGFMGGGDPEPAAPVVAGKPETKAESQAPTNEYQPVTGEAAPSTVTPQTSAYNTKPTVSDGSHPSDILGSVINDAIRTQQEELTIFEQVTRKIRNLTPGLAKKQP